jgi:DNA-binding NarL/FixJ family response regulator
MNGTELASELKKQRADLPVVFMSGYSPEVAGRELADSERGHLVPKPASPRAILEAVQRALAGRDRLREDPKLSFKHDHST